MRDRRPALRRLLAPALPAGLVLLCVAAVAPAAHAQLLFTPCTDKGQKGFECATLRVPLDRSGKVPGTVALRVERLIQAVQPARTLVNIEGGPGGSATARAQQSRRLFAPLRDRYQLVLVDPRGIGASRPVLKCREYHPDCGTKGRFYSTTDNVDDLEAVRAALGTDRLFLYGTSYGTYTAQRYARAYPQRTERIALDSPVGPDGLDATGSATFAAIDPMLRRLCAGTACAGIATDLVRDTARLVRRLSEEDDAAIAETFTRTGRRWTAQVVPYALYSVLLAGDENVLLRALLPGAIRAGLEGDFAPLGRLALLDDQRFSSRALNRDIFVPTACGDLTLPWKRSDGRRARDRAFTRALDAVPAAALGPFDREALREIAVGGSCIAGPYPAATSGTFAPPPTAVPTLVLQGEGDLRTPPVDATAIAAAIPGTQVMEVPFRAHGVLRTTVACGQRALAAFVADRPVGNPCATTQPLLPIQPTPPRSRAAVGGTSRAVALRTVADAQAVAQVQRPRGGTVALGGLHGGTLRGTRAAGEQAAAATLRLKGYAYVPGTRVTGTVKVRAGVAHGRLTVTARGQTRRIVL